MHGGRLVDYEFATGRSREELIDFSANLNPLAPPESVHKAIARSLRRVQEYPDPLSRRLRTAFSTHVGTSYEEVFAANGASEVIDLFLRALQPKRVLVLEPSFSEYAHAAKRSHLATVSIAMPADFSLPSTEMIEQLQKGDVIILNTPHNPSGRFYSRSELAIIYEAVREKDAYALIDEAFIDFVDEGEQQSSIPLINEHLMVVRSFTKMYGIAGLRLGFGIGSKKMVEMVQGMRDGWSVNVVAEEAGLAALHDYTFAAQTRDWLREERVYCMDRLQAMNGVTVYPSAANFLLVNGIAAGLNVSKWQERLLALGLFVRNCDSYGTFSSGVFRMAILLRRQNEQLLDALALELGR